MVRMPTGRHTRQITVLSNKYETKSNHDRSQSVNVILHFVSLTHAETRRKTSTPKTIVPEATHHLYQVYTHWKSNIQSQHILQTEKASREPLLSGQSRQFDDTLLEGT